LAGNRSKAAGTATPGPWRAWKRLSRHGRAIKFIQTYCRSPKGEGYGEPLRLGRFQKEFLEEALAPGVQSAAESFPRGNGKSTFSAGIAAWAGFDDDLTGAPSVPIVATTVGQAKRSVYNTVLSMVRAEPELATRSQVFTAWGSERIYIPTNEGEIFPIANATDTLQGLDPSLAIMDEIGFQPLTAWDSLLLASGKRSRSLVMALGTPGLDRENALWHLRELVQSGVALPGFVWKEHAAEPGCEIGDRRQWRKANPAIRAGFLREDALVTAHAMSLPSHFRIFRLGQWVDGVESWLGDDGRMVLDLLRSDYQLVPKAPTWAGIDVGLVHDSTAVTLVQYRTDRPEVLHAVTRLWVPTRTERVDLSNVVTFLREASLTYRLGGVSFDPRLFDFPAQVLHDEGLPMVEVPQSVERMTPIIGELYERIHNQLVTFTPDPVVEQQILNAEARVNERAFTLSKGKSRGRIDAAIAWALAVDRALNRAKPRPALFVGAA
jgi:phage terminase large subunit-like protein